MTASGRGGQTGAARHAGRRSPAQWITLVASIIAVMGAAYIAVLFGRLSILRLHTTVLERQLSVVDAPDALRVDLKGQPDAPGAGGRAYISRSRGVVLMADHLPPLAADRAYQLWIVTSRATVSLGVLEAGSTGSIASTIEPPASLDAPVSVVVTIAPASGAPAPTGPRVLVGTVGG